MKVISLKCPECGASLSIEEGRTQCFCQYCGTKIMLDDERSYTKTIHTIDDAKIREVEANREIRLKEMEIQREKDKHKRAGITVKIVISIILGIVGLPCLFLGFASDSGYGLAIAGEFCVLLIMMIWVIGASPNNKK